MRLELPARREDALALLRSHGEAAVPIAGGTALVLLMKQRLVQPELLVSLQGVAGLDAIEARDGSLCIGAAAPHRAVERHPAVRERLPVLARTFRAVATARIRNMATVGGALAHADPSQDPPVTLLALGAQVILASSDGEREVPLDAFFTDYYETVRRPDELVTEVRVPLPPAASAGVYEKFLPRTADDYATVSAAVQLQVDPDTRTCRDCRIAMGCVGATPLLAPRAEALVRGEARSDALLREAGAVAGAAADPVDDVRGSADYKRDMVGVFVRRALARAWDAAAAAAEAA